MKDPHKNLAQPSGAATNRKRKPPRALAATTPKSYRIAQRLPLHALPKRFLFLDLETRGGLRDFQKIELLVGGVVEARRKGKYKIEAGPYEFWTLENIEGLRQRLEDFDGLIVGMNLYGYDYRVLERYFNTDSIISKTLDLQYSLWKIGAGSVALGKLAENNLRQQKVPGTDMAKFWDRGDQEFVLERNRVDCELTFQLYELLLQRGYLWASFESYFQISETNIELLFEITGAMQQLSAEDWRWRITNHGGIRGDRRFLGIPYALHQNYDPSKKAIFLRAKCHSCSYDTLVAAPKIRNLIEWLGELHCENCGTAYAPPRKGYLVRRKHAEYDAHLQWFLDTESWRSKANPKYIRREAPAHFEVFRRCGSFEVLMGGYHHEMFLFTYREYRKFMQTEEQLRNALLRAAKEWSMRRWVRWNRWHPSTAYWRLRTEGARRQNDNA